MERAGREIRGRGEEGRERRRGREARTEGRGDVMSAR